MKPIKLTMTAFGPYKNTEVINFEDLDDNNLFVISGNTGAGKTTIFDGICFALYGSASGTDRDDTKMLRSHFADDAVHTSIELEFSIHNHTYRILRQLGHVKQGNKTKTGERYEFYERVDGREIPCVDRQIVSEIDKKIESIIGLTQDQFKQIVMLPQGEFRKLLTSQTENKEAILRRLFKTENYKQLSELLRNKKNAVDQKFNHVKQLRDHYIDSISGKLPKRDGSALLQLLSAEYYNESQIIAGLDDEISFYQNQIVIDQQAYEEAYNTHGKKLTAFHQAAALNDRFQELDQKENKLKELDEQVPVFAKKEKQLEKAERASNITVYEQHAEEWIKDENIKTATLKKAEIVRDNADKKFEKARGYYQQEENKKDVREDVGKKLDRLKEYLPVVEEIDERKRQLEELANNGKKTHEALEKVRAELENKTKTTDQLNVKIKTMDKDVSQLPDKQQKLTEMREKVKVLMAYIKLKEKQTILEKDVQGKEKAFTSLRKKYRNMEKTWLNNQASILASHLHDGDTCPVCGSVDHPQKAIAEDDMVTKDQLETFKEQMDEKDNLYRNATGDLNANLAQLEEKKAEVVQYGIQLDAVTTVKNQLVEDGKHVNAEVDRLTKLREELKKQKDLLEKVTDLIKQLQPEKDQLEKLYQEQKNSYDTSRAVYKEQLRNIPEEVRVLTELEKEINKMKERKVMLEKAWEEAQVLFQQAKEEQTKAINDLAHAEKQLAETKEKREEAVSQFKQALKTADFATEEVYNDAKMLKDARLELKEEIQQFKQHHTTLKQQVADLQDSLKDKVRVDLTVLKQELVELKQAYEIALNKLNLSKENYQESTDLKRNLIETTQAAKEHEKQLATITDLYDVLRGQNDQKISFERYLQIEYLEQIIEAANERLKRLSNGQFYLIRSDRQESHGRQSGLALDVYDSYTGQPRDVKTLSGGEKFNASLCLALGMSDTIQSFQGNIAINTMFIDEGFGSLDEESLNKSIDTLIDLQQSGRMIGVISHVQELKNMFPAILEVLKTKEGYSKTKFVVR